MGHKYALWRARSSEQPQKMSDLGLLLKRNRQFADVEKLQYGDHGLYDAIEAISTAIHQNKRIALYADYDVDGTMSCVSWIWFLEAIGYKNYIHYIPCRFREGYGLNLSAVKYLIDEQKADVIITMDTGITANEEAAYCSERGVQFICTDHHKVQKEKMPDCIIVNPKLHPDALYQELCGCGITFVLLRQLAAEFPVPQKIWTDLLALAGMATICDVVPLNGVNHRLARMGVDALLRSDRQVLKKLRDACAAIEKMDEKDVGFRLGPRINAVGRLEHADKIISAFTQNDPDELIEYMNLCNEQRKDIQKKILAEAMELAKAHAHEPILFLGGDWHPGVVGIAASKIAETFWRPTWLFHRSDTVAKGSARSIPEFDVTDAMTFCRDQFTKFGGHRAAGGFSFHPDQEGAIRESLCAYAKQMRTEKPQIWDSKIDYDCSLHLDLAKLDLCELLDNLKPFGFGFEEPIFRIRSIVENVQHYADKSTGEPRHSAITIRSASGRGQKIMFFNEVITDLSAGSESEFLAHASRNTFRGTTSLSLSGVDWNSRPEF